MSECNCALPPEHYNWGLWHMNERGYAYEKCPMLMRLTLAQRMSRAGVPEQYLNYTKATWRGDWSPALDEWIRDERRVNLYIWGSNGSGKTHLATAILGHLLERGVAGMWCSAKDLPDLQPEKVEADRALEEKYRTVPVLVMDDLFSEQTFKAERVRNTADRRYRSALATIYTSMLEPLAALALDSDLGSRACSGLRIERGGIDRRLVGDWEQ